MADEGLWIKTAVAADGAYIVTIEAGPDVTFPLDRQAATDYAMAVITAAVHAQHDVAVRAQLTRKVGLSDDNAVAMIAALREQRAPIDDAATAPLRFVPGVSASTGRPLIALHLGGKQIGQLDHDQAYQHALAVLQCLANADSDTAYHRHLTSHFGVPDSRARNIVGDVSNWYDTPPEQGEPTP